MAGKTGKTKNTKRRTPNAEIKAGEHPLVLFTSKDGAVSVPATVEQESVWLTQKQMAQVFEVKRPAITKHLANIFKTGELDEESTCSILEHMGQGGSRTYATRYYNLDAISSVGYRVKSQRGVEFRRRTPDPFAETAATLPQTAAAEQACPRQDAVNCCSASVRCR